MFFQAFLMDVVLGEPFFVRFFFGGWFCPPLHCISTLGEVEGPHGSCRGLGATSSQPCPKH